MSKQRTVFTCENCGYESPKWLGQCPDCQEWNSMVEQKLIRAEKLTRQLVNATSSQLQSLPEVDSLPKSRIATKLREFNRVLSGGLLPDQAVLLAGEPGVGKSTLLLQVALDLASDMRSLYISAEESVNQVASRAHRIGVSGELENLQFLANADLSVILQNIINFKPQLVFVDSIQTIYDPEIGAMTGSVSQVRNCAAQLVSLAKEQGFALVLVGHINKDGSIAGPKVLEHLVDTVLQFEGESQLDYRILRSLKNRFGRVGEVGIFVMEEKGLVDISPDNNIFVDAEASENIGVARTIVVEAERPLLLEVQALVSPTVYSFPKRVANGITTNRLQTICAIVSKFTKIKLSDSDVYVKTTGGYRIKDAAADLAIAMALISSATKKSVAATDCYLGEINLAGRVLRAGKIADRVSEAERFGILQLFANSDAQKSSKHTQITRIDKLSRLA